MPKSVESGNLNLNKVGIRWMSAETDKYRNRDVYGTIERPRHGVRHGMGNPVAADPRLCALRHRAGGGFAPGDEPAVARRPAALDREGARARGSVVVCSYAAVALARSIFRKGANFTAAMAFEMASTNLVLELGIIMLVLLGWQFTLAEFVGAPIMVDVAGHSLPALSRAATAR